jgi:hypothetical protein
MIPRHAPFRESLEKKLGHWVGVAETQGDALTYLILDNNSGKVVMRSQVRTALNPDNPNLCTEKVTGTGVLSREYGEVQPSGEPILLSASEISLDGEPPCFQNMSDLKLPKFSPDKLIGLTFVRETKDGQKVRAKIMRQIITMENDACGHEDIWFLVKLGEKASDDMMGYHELCEITDDQNNAENDKDTERAWIFKSIVGHIGPLNHRHTEYKGSKYNMLVQWEDGTETYEALDQVRKDDPVTLVVITWDTSDTIWYLRHNFQRSTKSSKGQLQWILT